MWPDNHQLLICARREKTESLSKVLKKLYPGATQLEWKPGTEQAQWVSMPADKHVICAYSVGPTW